MNRNRLGDSRVGTICRWIECLQIGIGMKPSGHLKYPPFYEDAGIDAMRIQGSKENLCVAMFLSTLALLVSLTACDQPSKAELPESVKRGDVDAVRSFLAKGIDPDIQDPSGATALHIAARDGRIEIVELLLSKGAAIDASSEPAVQALFSAAMHGRPEIADFLLENGVDPNTRELEIEWTPLMYAAYYGHAGVVESLLKRGADPTIENKEGITALACAESAGHPEMVDLLRNAGAKK